MTPTTQSREHVAYTGRRSDRLMNETGLALNFDALKGGQLGISAIGS